MSLLKSITSYASLLTLSLSISACGDREVAALIEELTALDGAQLTNPGQPNDNNASLGESSSDNESPETESDSGSIDRTFPGVWFEKTETVSTNEDVDSVTQFITWLVKKSEDDSFTVAKCADENDYVLSNLKDNSIDLSNTTGTTNFEITAQNELVGEQTNGIDFNSQSHAKKINTSDKFNLAKMVVETNLTIVQANSGICVVTAKTPDSDKYTLLIKVDTVIDTVISSFPVNLTINISAFELTPSTLIANKDIIITWEAPMLGKSSEQLETGSLTINSYEPTTGKFNAILQADMPIEGVTIKKITMDLTLPNATFN